MEGASTTEPATRQATTPATVGPGNSVTAPATNTTTATAKSPYPTRCPTSASRANRRRRSRTGSDTTATVATGRPAAPVGSARRGGSRSVGGPAMRILTFGTDLTRVHPGAGGLEHLVLGWGSHLARRHDVAVASVDRAG